MSKCCRIDWLDSTYIGGMKEPNKGDPNGEPKTGTESGAKHGSGDVKKDMGRTLDKLFGPKKGDGSNRS